MNGANQSESRGTVSVTEWVADRRRTERVNVSLPVRLSSPEGETHKIEEVTTTLDASRDGLYFATKLPSYVVGMSLVVAFPYSPSAERNVYFLATVVRIDKLADGQLGIAVELVMTIANKERLRPISLKVEGIHGQPPGSCK